MQQFNPLPNGPDRWLLIAALDDGQRAVHAWRSWESAVGALASDQAQQRLFPLVCWNLRRLGVAAHDLASLRGQHRYWWSQNQLKLHQLVQTARVLAADGVPAMALKGMPLGIAYYPNLGLRPMSDIDVLVPTHEADRALDSLLAAGYRPAEPVERRAGRIQTRRQHALSLLDANQRCCDLHWHMFHDCLGDSADEGIWARAQPREILGQPMWFPAPEDLLLHICAHGLMANPLPAWRWVADAAMVLSTVEPFDWRLLLDETHDRLLVAPMRLALRTVAAIVPHARVCLASLAALEAERIPWYARLELQTRLQDLNYRYSVAGRLCEWSRRHPRAGFWPRVRALPGFLAEIWEVEPWQLPRALVPAVQRYLGRWHDDVSSRGRGSTPTERAR